MLDTFQDYVDAKLTHSLHTSEAKSYKGCRRRWNWLFREYYYPKTTAKPLEFGVAMHKGCEVLYDPMLWDKPDAVVLALACAAFAGECDKQKATYEQNFGHDPLVDADHRERKDLGLGMLKYFMEHGRKDDKDKGFKPLYVEIKFEVPLGSLRCSCNVCWERFVAWKKTQHPQWVEASESHLKAFRQTLWDGLPVSYGGRIDCIMEGPDGRVWVVDWKTAAQLSTDREEFLQLDDQLTRYLWAMKLTGYRVAGFLYHELRKAYPQEPEPLNRKYKGCLYSQNKQNAVEVDTYLKTVQENDPEAYELGLYNDYIEYLRSTPNQFAARFTQYRNDAELDQCGTMIMLEAMEMIDPTVFIYPNAGRFSCGNCAFRQPCLEQNSDGDVFYTLTSLFDKRKYHYYEDKKPSTDSKGNE